MGLINTSIYSRWSRRGTVALWVPTAARFRRAVAYTPTPFVLRMGFRRAASVSVLRIASET
ncbi:hypothetical protein [Providencia sp. PROV033]|uniref:hypothetical protein n=1 Tax=Providencia sp. PROV033 TaxID=2949765 RepID=UPI00234BE477|nr:hypothetical protein [Providencia sp. PROV033]